MKLKAISLLLAAGALFAPARGQDAAGSYEKIVIEAPASLETGETVTVTQAASDPAKIEVSGLIPGQKFHAALRSKDESSAVYSVPAQEAGAFAIRRGDIVFDAEEGKLTISLNSPESEDDGSVSISSDGSVSAGGVRIGSDGSISGAGVEISSEGVKTGASPAGALTFIGVKKS